VLDENGQKMSKSKGNALDPVDLIHTFGADALRWALLADSAPWNPKKFSERVVQEAKSKVIDTLVNVYGFYVLYAKLDGYDPEQTYELKKTKLDEWILSRLHSTVKRVTAHLEDYGFTSAAREIAVFIEELSNWYVRRSRDRFWSEGMDGEKAAAYDTLHEVLVTLSQLLAPFTPFVADDIHENLTGKSVHLVDYPVYNEGKVNEKLEREMAAVLQVVELGRSIRNTHSLKVKQPLRSLSLVVTNEDIEWNAYRDVIKDELNVKKFNVEQDDENLVSYVLKLNFKQAGPKFGKQVNAVNQTLKNLSADETKDFVQQGERRVTLPSGEKLTLETADVLVEKVPKEGFAVASNGMYTAVLDTALTEALVQEGLAREVIRAVQDYRKKLDLPVNLRIDLELSGDAEVKEAVTSFEGLLQENLLLNSLCFTEDTEDGEKLKVGTKHVTLRMLNQ
jgi:isoleucyl-tRNA synthetase